MNVNCFKNNNLGKEVKMNHNQFEGKWDQMIGSIKEAWGNLTDQDLEKVKGKKDQLVGLIEEKYGKRKKKLKPKLISFLINYLARRC